MIPIPSAWSFPKISQAISLLRLCAQAADSPFYEVKTIFEAKVCFGYAPFCNGGGFIPVYT